MGPSRLLSDAAVYCASGGLPCGLLCARMVFIVRRPEEGMASLRAQRFACGRCDCFFVLRWGGKRGRCRRGSGARWLVSGWVAHFGCVLVQGRLSKGGVAVSSFFFLVLVVLRGCPRRHRYRRSVLNVHAY